MPIVFKIHFEGAPPPPKKMLRLHYTDKAVKVYVNNIRLLSELYKTYNTLCEQTTISGKMHITEFYRVKDSDSFTLTLR